MLRSLFRLGLAGFALVAPLAALAQNAPMQLVPKAPPAAAAIARSAAPAKVATADAAAAVQRANAWFNANTMMTADFVQLGPDGKKTQGTLYVVRPGNMRFEYDAPSPLEVVADGTSVAVRNRKLNTQDMYFIGQTPLKFLLKETIDIARDTKILDVQTSPAGTIILIEDKATFGGTSRIRLVFDSTSGMLKQWTVTDPQGYETLVQLSNIDTKHRPESSLFRINRDNYRQ